MTKLIIVESPTKCAVINRYLGFEYSCVATCGHLAELLFENITVDLEKNTVHYKHTLKKGSRAVQTRRAIKQAISNCTEVILASDSDREGESIAAQICKLFKLDLRTTKRARFGEITQAAIVAAVAAPSTINVSLVQAQHARQIIDLLVGYTVSPALWREVKRDDRSVALSAGRCQTPALHIVYANQLDINHQKSADSTQFAVTGAFTNKNIPFRLSDTFPTAAQAKSFLLEDQHCEHKYASVVAATKTTRPPSPLTTSDLLQRASNRYGFSPKVTMAACQELYEAGRITYMRTDSRRYSNAFLVDQMAPFIEKHYSHEYALLPAQVAAVGTPAVEDSANRDPDSAHEAIRPTRLETRWGSVGKGGETSVEQQQKVYRVIWETTLASCLPDYAFKELTLKITSSRANVEYVHTCEQTLFLGWKIAGPRVVDSSWFEYLAFMHPTAPVAYSELVAEAREAGAKYHLTEARLIKTLDDLGIGRPSTFAYLIEQNQKRKYVTVGNVPGTTRECARFSVTRDAGLVETVQTKTVGAETNKLLIQPIGERVAQFTMTRFKPIFDCEYTVQMEAALDSIVAGTSTLTQVCLSCAKEIQACDGNSNSSGGGSEPAPVQLAKHIDRKLDSVNGAGAAVGVFNGENVHVLKGKFGYYAKWVADSTTGQTDTVSLASLGHIAAADGISFSSICSLIERKQQGLALQDPTIVRQISPCASIRVGKQKRNKSSGQTAGGGDYIYFKSKLRKHPQFYSIERFPGDYLTCPLDELGNWIEDTYGISIDES